MQISNFIVSKATSYIDGKATEKEQNWPDVGSLFQSTICKSSSSAHSSKSSVRHQEAAAEAAASQAVLQVLEEQEIEQIEIERLEAEVRRKAAEQEALARRLRLEREAEELKLRMQREEDEAKFKAKQEAEYAALQRSLDERRRKLKHLEKVKDLRAAQARMHVYDQMSVTEEQKVVTTKTSTESKALGHASFPPQQEHTISQTATTPANDGTTELVKALAGALNSSRIPVPEPSIFSGDPLRYSDWNLSFHTLIDQKNIPENEKIFYLHRYVSGQAKSALYGYFLLGTESAYAAAWKILDERYGNPFTIAKAYRDKLQAWPKITSKDSIGLKDFANFLCSCEAATVHIKSLEILSDCNENRKVLSKLPDWLTASWNHKVIEIEEETNKFPTFSQFVSFLTREAKIACNPVTSLQSLKLGESDNSERLKLTRPKNFGAKTLTTTSQEKTTFTCLFCKKPKHTLQKCRSFLEKAVTESKVCSNRKAMLWLSQARPSLEKLYQQKCLREVQ